MKRFALLIVILALYNICQAQLRIWTDGKADSPAFEMMPQDIDSITFAGFENPNPQPDPEPNPNPDPEPDPDPQPKYPTVEVIAGYASLVFHITTDICTNLIWVGTCNNWGMDSQLYLQAIDGWQGWYLAMVPVLGGDRGKILQLSNDGQLDWLLEAAAPPAVRVLQGETTIQAHHSAGTEINPVESTEPTYIEISAWLNTPCYSIY